MPSTFSTRLRFELQATGENRSTWGNKLNVDLSLVDAAIAGWVSVAMADANVSLTTANASTDQARMAMVTLTGANTAIRNVTIPTVSKTYIIRNATTGGFAINVTNGSSSVSVPNGGWVPVWTDGTTVFTNPNISAANLSGVVPSASIAGSYTGIVGVGALNAGSITSGFGNINNGTSTLTTGAISSAGITSTGGIITATSSTFNGTAAFNSSVAFSTNGFTSAGNVYFSNASSTNIQNNNVTVNFMKKSGSGGFNWYKNTTGIVGGGGQTSLMNIDDSGNLTIPGEVGGLRFTSNSTNAIFGPPSAGTIYFRPNGPGSSAGQATINASGALVAPQLQSAGRVYTGTTASYLDTDGDPVGAAWSSWGSTSGFTATGLRIESRGAAYAQSAVNQCVTDSRMAGFVTGPNQAENTGYPCPSGYVMTGMYRYDVSQAWYARQPQLFIPNQGWFAAFPY